jgi:hypothetical protein
MGFRNGAWMKVWEVRPTASPHVVQIRGTTSIRKKDASGRQLDEWETDFSGFCSCIGDAAVNKINGISPAPSKDNGVSIHLKSVEVKKTSVNSNGEWKDYINFNIYDFDFGESDVNQAGGGNRTQGARNNNAQNNYQEELNLAYEGLSDDLGDEGLPF